MQKNSNFKDRVVKIVKSIPRGKVLTYKQVAMMAGSPNAMRAVGNVMKNNFDPTVPCHRVIASNGIGGYNGGVMKKIRKLKEEGVNIDKIYEKQEPNKKSW
ncbi:MAG TPA: MGMT family protein [Candidatus Paceibacterota bacterium]